MKRFKLILLLLISFGAMLNVRAQSAKSSRQINFIENSFSEALKRAAAQKKYLFVDAYTTWCGPCRMMKSTTFKDAAVASFFNNNFINVSIDMEKGQGPQLAQEWQVQAVPTLIVFAPNGKPVSGTTGYLSAGQLLKFGEQALKKK